LVNSGQFGKTKRGIWGKSRREVKLQGEKGVMIGVKAYGQEQAVEDQTSKEGFAGIQK